MTSLPLPPENSTDDFRQGSACADAQTTHANRENSAITTQLPPSDLIDPVRLSALLGEAGRRLNITAVAECSSTSTLLLQSASKGAPSGSVIVADRQTAGRGSRGRSWSAVPGTCLMFSLLWSFSGGLDRLSGLSLAAGVGIVEALSRCGITPISLKWPNDILYENGKLGGTLIELCTKEKQAMAVIGIGLNMHLPGNIGESCAAALPPAALEQTGKPLPERHILLARLLMSLTEVLDRFTAGGFPAVRDSWHTYHAWQDRRVRLLREGQSEQEVLCLGADMDGALLIETPNGIERCLSGEVSLRP